MTLDETMMMAALMLGPAFFSLLGMAAFGSPVIALLGEFAAKSQKKVFFDKYGQQTASMGLILLILLLVVEAIGIGIFYTKYPHCVQGILDYASPFTALLAVAGGFLVLGVPYLALWKRMRNAKGLHMFMGFGASACALAMVALAVPAKLAFNRVHGMADPDIMPLLMPMAIMYAIFIVVAAAALSSVYLVMRRNKDDFGRDYYNFSLPMAARWSLLPVVPYLACQGWLFAVLPETFKTMVMQTPLGLVWAAGSALIFICAIIWLTILRSKTPLQLKGLTFLSTILLWLSHTANLVVFINFMAI